MGESADRPGAVPAVAVPGIIAAIAFTAFLLTSVTRRTPSVRVCLTMPAGPAGPKAEPAKDAALRATLLGWIGDHPRVDRLVGPCAVRFVEEECAE